MHKVAKGWNELTPAGSPFRLKVMGYSKERNRRTRYTVMMQDGPLYEAHKSIILSVLEKITMDGDWQINVYAFNKQVACYEDAFQHRFRGWAARNLAKKIRAREADWEKDWSEMRVMIVRVMRRLCHALPADNVRNVVRECRAHWRSLQGPHDTDWKELNLGTKRIERVIVGW